MNENDLTLNLGDEVAMNDTALHFESLCIMVDHLEDDLNELTARRDTCKKCKRPAKTCLCPFIPERLLITKNIKIWIFQHPYEEKRSLRTTRIMENCMDEKNFQILRSTRFTKEKFPELEKVFKSENTFLVYPSERSISVSELADLIKRKETTEQTVDCNETDDVFNAIILDGTWHHAESIFFRDLQLQKLKQIKIDSGITSVYTIRTQPREHYLSTLETAAVILSTVEENPSIFEDLVRPLKALCKFQLDNGCVIHHSKELLLSQGKYEKPINKKHYSKVTKGSKLDFADKKPSPKTDNKN
jgi:DTW domain-containing protein YfiP